jgi:hypothetical protein
VCEIFAARAGNAAETERLYQMLVQISFAVQFAA